jgi:hypothetical protein
MPVQMLPRSSFALLAELGISVGSDCRVTGDIGVRSRSPEGIGWQLSLESGAVLAPQQRAVSPSVRVASQPLAALTDRLDGQADGAAGPFPDEQMPPLPLAPAPEPGPQGVTVGADHHESLGPGSYAALAVEGSVTLAAGDYVFTELTLGADASLASAGPVRISVLHGLRAAAGARLRPAGDDATAAALVILASGTDR